MCSRFLARLSLARSLGLSPARSDTGSLGLSVVGHSLTRLTRSLVGFSVGPWNSLVDRGAPPFLLFWIRVTCHCFESVLGVGLKCPEVGLELWLLGVQRLDYHFDF